MGEGLIIDRGALPPAADLEAAERLIPDLLDRLRDCEGDAPAALLASIESGDDVCALMTSVFGSSPFLTQLALREAAWLADYIQNGPDTSINAVLASIRNDARQLDDQNALARALRIAKRRLALGVALADIAGVWPLEKVTHALSDLADAATDAAAAFVVRRAAERGAFELDEDNDDPLSQSGFIILGMGKLGGRELNYSSDIDLICLYDVERIRTDDPDELQQHFIRMTRTLVKLIDERTADGYVFRVDLRLRPDPGSTPLALSTLAAETYYESIGQNWERAAMIKARPIAGDLEAGEMFLNQLRPFVWRKSLDFAAIQDIQSIKRQIHAVKGGGEIAVNGHNIKTGRGGIREIEFFAQTQQLIWGGREPYIRIPMTLLAIRALVDLGQVSTIAADELESSYRFLRHLEHRLQMQNDEQTQTLPDDDEGILRIAAFAGFANADDFRKTLLKHLGQVQTHYENLFDNEPALVTEGCGNLSFTGAESDPGTLQSIADMGFKDPKTIDAAIRAWHHGRIRATRSSKSRELLTELTPALLSAIADNADPDATFIRFDAFLTALPAGVQLFSMFQAYPHVMQLLGEVMGEAPRLAEHLNKRPHLLDSVLSADFYEPLPDVNILRADCSDALTDVQFLEDALDAVRRWNSDKRFQVGIQLLRRAITPTEAARHFSDIAEAALCILFPRVITAFEERHGRVSGGALAILALGKLGSRELTPSSDLDLIFVYDCEDISDQSDGERPLSAQQYFSRLGQRLISSVMSMTAEGTLYEIDMRLRPSGNKGPIATKLDGFQRYYQEDAWTWELMAMVRARVIFETNHLGGPLDDIVEKLVRRSRDQATVAKEVADMRGRIESTMKTRCPWSIKQAPGGQVDVDFIAQYLVLTLARNLPVLPRRESESVFTIAGQSGAISDDDAELLVEAKWLYRNMQTFLALTIEGDLTDEKVAAFSPALREDITYIAGCETFEELEDLLINTEARVRDAFTRIIGEPVFSKDAKTKSSD